MFALIVAALLSTLGTAQDRPTEADWDWLQKQGWQVIDRVMPVAGRSTAVATFRSHRDLYQDVPR